MVTISVCMIVKNEEDVLERSLGCASQIADEIIVVDTGSQDRTKEIAQSYTDKVYDFVWCDDFSKARNYAFSKATMDYCMWLDADDVILEEDIRKLIRLKQYLNKDVNIVMCKYHTSFDEDGQPVFTYYRERIVRNSPDNQWQGVIHEVIPLTGKIIYEDIAITHRKEHEGNPMRNLMIFEGMIKQGKTLDPREQFYYARELYYHARYQESINVLEHFLDDKLGWIENNIDACEIMGYCYEMLEEKDKALESYFRSFTYDLPRAELCCDIGKHFFDEGSYYKAIYWYRQALNCTRNDTSGAFVKTDCYGYIPWLQLCVCHYQVGNIEEAIHCNDEAANYKPNSAAVKQNKEFFSTLSSSDHP